MKQEKYNMAKALTVRMMEKQIMLKMIRVTVLKQVACFMWKAVMMTAILTMAILGKV